MHRDSGDALGNLRVEVSTRESDEIASFVIEDFYAACGNL